ncbi:hypothetical protein [Rheinheimera salexigens]|nr:hypothetical protein [Rheinheimera salexigens]
MSEKHNQGHSIELDDLLHRWLQFGVVNDNEQALLARVKAVFA